MSGEMMESLIYDAPDDASQAFAAIYGVVISVVALGGDSSVRNTTCESPGRPALPSAQHRDYVLAPCAYTGGQA